MYDENLPSCCFARDGECAMCGSASQREEDRTRTAHTPTDACLDYNVRRRLARVCIYALV